jgi:hypothetical protein
LASGQRAAKLQKKVFDVRHEQVRMQVGDRSVRYRPGGRRVSFCCTDRSPWRLSQHNLPPSLLLLLLLLLVCSTNSVTDFDDEARYAAEEAAAAADDDAFDGSTALFFELETIHHANVA